MPRQHQDSLLDAARQGEEGHETAAKHSARVRINSVPHTVDIRKRQVTAACDSSPGIASLELRLI